MDQGAKLFERSEFLAPPQLNAERGQPKAKLLGGLSFASFSLAAKENEGTKFNSLFYGIAYNSDPAHRRSRLHEREDRDLINE